MVTPEVKAVCLCFPCKDAIRDRYREEDARFKEMGQEPVDPTVFWIKQTVCPYLPSRSLLCLFVFWPEKNGTRWLNLPQIPNACGTMALIHALANVCIHP